jgi:hypothetical protein
LDRNTGRGRRNGCTHRFLGGGESDTAHLGRGRSFHRWSGCRLCVVRKGRASDHRRSFVRSSGNSVLLRYVRDSIHLWSDTDAVWSYAPVIRAASRCFPYSRNRLSRRRVRRSTSWGYAASTRGTSSTSAATGARFGSAKQVLYPVRGAVVGWNSCLSPL